MKDPLAHEEVLTRQTDLPNERDLYRIQRGTRIVYLSVYGFNVFPSQRSGDNETILQEIRDLLPLWRRTEWRTAILRKNTVTGEIEFEADVLPPHCMDSNVLRVLGLLPLYINVLDLIEVKPLKGRVSRVALLQEETNVPIFMVMKLASFARDVAAVQREVETYAYLVAHGAGYITPEFMGYVYEEHEGRVVGFLMEDFEGEPATMNDLEVCQEALAQLHRFGVIHGDIHPSNFLVHEDFGVRLVDFESSQVYPLGNAFVNQFILRQEKEDELRELEEYLLGSPGPSVS